VGEVQRARSYRTARQLKPAELDELVMAYAAGATVFELGDRFGIDRRTVGKHLRGRGVDTTPPGLDPEDVSAAAELYREGWSLLRIAEKFGTTASTVRRRLLEIGLRMRKPWERV
jgi:DNA-directed RNA polymerase specialized sigma24 family protein